MSTGIFTAVCMVVLSQGASDVFYTNQRNHRVPVNIQESRRPEIRELLLYATSDQGRDWKHVAGPIAPDKEFFAFYAPSDGVYWMRVALVNRQGMQEPDDKSLMSGPPDLKMVIDTTKPVVKAFQAQRHGDEIVVNWDVQEEHPDLTREGLRLEFQIKDSLLESWKPIAFQPGLKGQTSFNPGHKQPVDIRLTVRDLAGNQSYSPASVAGTVAAAGFNTPPGNVPSNSSGAGVLPVEIQIPKQPLDVARPILPPPPTEYKASFGNSGGVVMPPPPLKEAPPYKVVADSQAPPQAEVVKPAVRDPQFPLAPGGIPAPGNPLAETKPIAPARKPLPMMQYINQHLIKLQYEMKRVGPSGIGGVEIWLTKDDGANWEPYAKVMEKEVAGESVQGRQERDFEFIDERRTPYPDGIYGLALVVKNRAGLGRTPRAGDAPEIRVEIDTKKPVAQLIEPMPDPQHPHQLLLKWRAEDKNLTDTPINLEYAEKLEGPWLPIELNLKNTGRYANEKVTGDYSWKVPAGTPVQVFLRLRVRDKADNEGMAITRDAQFVDLVEPEGALIGILPPMKRQ